MRQRVITVPKDKLAEQLLDYDKANHNHLLELEIMEEQFLFLLNDGIIELINHICNVNIDDYEDERITDSTIFSKAIDKLEKHKSFLDTENSLFLDKVINLFKEAKLRETGVYFFF